MLSLPGRSLIVVPCAVLVLGCKSNPVDATPAASTPAGATVIATAKSGAVAGSGQGFCDAQPYAHRCDAACKSAHARAVTSTCAAETNAFTKAVPNPTELGKCLVGCRKPGSDGTCVGAADKAACECELACYRSLPADTLEKAQAAERCYAQAITAACR